MISSRDRFSVVTCSSELEIDSCGMNSAIEDEVCFKRAEVSTPGYGDSKWISTSFPR